MISNRWGTPFSVRQLSHNLEFFCSPVVIVYLNCFDWLLTTLLVPLRYNKRENSASKLSLFCHGSHYHTGALTSASIKIMTSNQCASVICNLFWGFIVRKNRVICFWRNIVRNFSQSQCCSGFCGTSNFREILWTKVASLLQYIVQYCFVLQAAWLNPFITKCRSTVSTCSSHAPRCKSPTLPHLAIGSDERLGTLVIVGWTTGVAKTGLMNGGRV